MKPKLLVVELWGLGDLVIATHFLKEASERFEVTLVAKPYAQDLQARFWSGVTVVPFIAPWTAFKHKYRVAVWPWGEIIRLARQLRRSRFDFGLSARWDPRDHILLDLAHARTRLGFPRLGSQFFLTQPLLRPDPRSHRYEYWRVLAAALGFELPRREKLPTLQVRRGDEILVHTGAGQPVRVWPLERYRNLVVHLRKAGYKVRVACDPEQRQWWTESDEGSVATPRTVSDLLDLIGHAGVFVGNDSGPGHLAAFCGLPTFTIFGPQLPEWFAPLHPAADWLEGKACPFKPCSDYCRFAIPVCTVNSGTDEVTARVEEFVARNLAESVKV